MGPSAIKTWAKRSKWAVVAGRIAVERTRDLRRSLGRRESAMGDTHRDLELEQSLDYVDAVYDDYLAYAALDARELSGMRVLELGPGDNFGVAVRFAARGAEAVTVDRFIPRHDPAKQARIYAAMAQRLGGAERELLERALAGEPAGLETRLPVAVHRGMPIEAAPGELGESGFDLIVSRAVLEHVYDLERAFEAMDALLRPGGLLVHKVDLRDHGLFTEGGQHPLTFLTIGDRLYGWMGEESAGLPNRRLIGWYRETLSRLGYQAEYRTTHLAGREAELVPHPHQPPAELLAPSVKLVERIRPRLLERYRDLPASELAVAGFFVTARKPA